MALFLYGYRSTRIWSPTSAERSRRKPNVRRFVLTELTRGVENHPSVVAHNGVEQRWRTCLEPPPLWTGLLDTVFAKRSFTMGWLLAIVLVGIGVAVYLWLHLRL